MVDTAGGTVVGIGRVGSNVVIVVGDICTLVRGVEPVTVGTLVLSLVPVLVLVLALVLVLVVVLVLVLVLVLVPVRECTGGTYVAAGLVTSIVATIVPPIT